MLLIYLGLLVLTTTVFCELAAKKEWLPYWVSRKILHVVAVGSCAVAVYDSDIPNLYRPTLTYIASGATVLLLFLIFFGGLMKEESGRKPWGIVWFPLAFSILLFSRQGGPVIAYFMAILAICDPAATIAGKLLSKPKTSTPTTLDAVLIQSNKVSKSIKPFGQYTLTGDVKTITGSIAFFVSFLILSALFPAVEFSWGADAAFPSLINPEQAYGWPSIILLGLFLTLGEALGSKGLDNLIIPLLAWLLTAHMFRSESISNIIQLLPFALLFYVITTRRKSLTVGGAITAALLGILVSLYTGPEWLIPLILFFASSSLIGKFLPAHLAAGDAKQKQPRDATQVLANGMIYGIIAISMWSGYRVIKLFTDQTGILLLIAAAIATADTWSSEIGQYFKLPTYDLVKFRKVPPGLSGGISWPGTLAGLAGAAFIAVSCSWLLPYFDLRLVLMITLSGFIGMLIDSVLGSLLQATYQHPETGALSDVCPEGGELVSGFSWMTNDLVNFLAIGIGVTVGPFGFELLGMF